MVILYSNKDIVLSFIQKAADYPEWSLGKKALQKSLYFFNLEEDCFSFRWADYGPLCGEIQQIAHDLWATEKISVKDVKTKNGKILKKMEWIKQQQQPPVEVKASLDATLNKTIKFVSGRTSRDLELLASVHFWAERKYDDGEDTVDYVFNMLEELKPEAGFTCDDVKKAIDELTKHGFLRDETSDL